MRGSFSTHVLALAISISDFTISMACQVKEVKWMKVAYFLMFGVLSQTVKVQGTYGIVRGLES